MIIKGGLRMKKKLKLIIPIVLMIISVVCIFVTLNYAKNHLETSSSSSEISNGNMPSMGENSNSEMPSGAPPDMNSSSGDNSSNDSSSRQKPNGTPPNMNSSDSSNSGMPSGESSESGEMADGGFAGEGETLSANKELTVVYIVILGVCVLVFSSSLLYLIMSKFGKEKAFKNGSKVVIFALSDIILVALLTFLVTLFGNKVYLNSSSSSNVSYSSGDDLHLDMSNWSYDSSSNVYYQIGIVYASKVETESYESMGIYVPGDYMDCKANGDKYTCTLNTENKVGNYTSETAPIVMPINTAGYSAQKAPTSYSSKGLSDYLDAGFVYVYAGARGRNEGNDYNEGAPYGVTDFKAAIRYLRYNATNIAGSEDRIFVFGHSGGGAQSTLLGATGDSELYTPYLESIGAIMKDDDSNSISDSIAGVMAWCPITSLDYANEAYEWNMGQYTTSNTRASNTWTSALSKDLAEAYASYINALKLKDGDTTLKLSETGDGVYTSGTYYDYLLSVIEDSLNNYLSDNYSSTSDMENYIKELNSDETWVTFNSSTKKVSISSIEAFVNHCKSASKSVGAFDDLSRSQAENKVFGVKGNTSLHFDPVMADLLKNNASKYSKYSDYKDYSSEYESDLKVTDSLAKTIEYRQNMYNPMYYLSSYYDGYKTSTVAKNWRIRTGITQGDTANTVEVNLALALENYGISNVDFETVWNQGHTTAERTGSSTTNFISWVNESLK